jgi:predicted HAD superfamily Cof-like phosphohydrolase
MTEDVTREALKETVDVTENDIALLSGDIKHPSAQELVAEFMTTYGQTIRTNPVLDVPERQLRFDLIKEEFEELEKAQSEDDFIEVVDAWADLVYVIYGAALAHGVDLDAVLAEVQRSNMSKLGEDGKPIYRESDGKVLKGPNFFTPDVSKVLFPPKPE